MLTTLSTLVPNPLHPAVVHLPIALTILVPAFAIGALFAIHRGVRPMRAWGIPIALLAALSLSAWVSIATGQTQGERVERVVPEQAIESHEEAAEAFLALSLVVLAVAAVGLVNGRTGTVARHIAAGGTLALVVAGYSVGHSGGALVYQHGAASAYTSPASTGSGSDGRAEPAARERGEHGDR
jgi:uncharacterized membrane protein